MSERAFHDFYAPIDGAAVRFSMRCVDGQPKELLAMVSLHGQIGSHRGAALYAQLDLIKYLLKDLPWMALRTQRRGNIGAIIEAAEARRAEIYGPLAEVA